MKKEGKVLALIFIVSVFLILSISFVSASLLGDIGNWFKNLFGRNERSNLGGELGNVNPLSSNTPSLVSSSAPSSVNLGDKFQINYKAIKFINLSF